MRSMFSNCNELRYVDLSSFNTKQCRYFNDMFKNTVNLTAKVNRENCQNMIDAITDDVDFSYELF